MAGGGDARRSVARPAAMAALTLAAGCAAATAPPAAGPPSAGLVLVPALGGLDVVGSGGREIGFGRARDGAIESGARVTGSRPVPVPCGAGREAVALGPLTMVFEAGRFVGWRVADGRAAGERLRRGGVSAGASRSGAGQMAWCSQRRNALK